MVAIKVNIASLHRTLGNGKTGFFAWPVITTDGVSIAGLYSGYGRTVACKQKPVGKGWNGESNVYYTPNNIISVQD